MKNVARIVVSLILSIAYMLASTGFGIHECNHKGTKDLLLINSNKNCSEIHDHCSCNSEGCQANKHDDNCCDTHIYHLDIDAENTTVAVELSPDVKTIDVQPYLMACLSGDKIISTLDVRDAYHGPPLLQRPLLPVISQWRL